MSTTLAPSVDHSRPTFCRSAMFRYAFVYWTLFCVPIISTQIDCLAWIGKAVERTCNGLALWVGETILQIPYEISTADNGSGDKTIDWLWVLCSASLALIVTVVWLVADRRRAHDVQLRAILRVLVRYTLAFTILGYGAIKIFGGQFSPPTPSRLLQHYGDSSPMGLLWTFMGASRTYVFFSGAAETAGALLLFFRRTTALGALLLLAVLTNVVLLNFCYDVPVKINSSHYLAMCIFLLLPELGRLANVLLFNRATHPVPPTPTPVRWMRTARVVLKYVVIAAVVFATAKQSIVSTREEPEPWYGGYWTVTTFVRDGNEVPAIVTDTTRWRRIRFQTYDDKTYVRWRFMDDSYDDLYVVKVDDNARTFTLTYAQEIDDIKKAKHPVITLTYVHVDAEHFKLEGKVGTHTIAVQVERLNIGSMLLVNRGFHWINEEPFNQ